MITKTFEIVTTCRIRVNLPDAYGEDQFLESWREGLWHVDDVEGIAAYAARIVAEHNDPYDNDGVGTMRSEDLAKWDDAQGRNQNPMRVTFRVLSEDMDTFRVDDDGNVGDMIE